MAIGVAHSVDCTITQGSTAHTWSAYKFGEISEWISVFHADMEATIKISSGGKLLFTHKAMLTPGPLVVTLKPDNVPAGHSWPPMCQQGGACSLELIAAS